MDATDLDQPSTTDTGEVILVSCYADLDCAVANFEELTRQIKRKRIRVRHSVLMGKNSDGMPIVLDTSSGHHGRTGAIVGATMGFLMGLLTLPALPVSLVVGTITGAAVTNLVDHEIRVGLRHDIADRLSAASGVVISLVRGLDELWTRRALGGATTTFSLSFPTTTIASLERAVGDAMDGVQSPSDATKG